ncbi:hypothetical protein Rfer_3912 [Rhodoferax ferrireducens T118]|nr:hypothetical protein Rfer_3912 [Rhodoferax ferrireducens T118]
MIFTFQSAPDMNAGRSPRRNCLTKGTVTFQSAPDMNAGRSGVQRRNQLAIAGVSIRARHECRAIPLRPARRPAMGQGFNPRPT